MGSWDRLGWGSNIILNPKLVECLGSQQECRVIIVFFVFVTIIVVFVVTIHKHRRACRKSDSHRRSAPKPRVERGLCWWELVHAGRDHESRIVGPC